MDIEITEVLDLGQDVLEVHGLGPADAEGNRKSYQAHGWVSAMSNHFDDVPLEEGVKHRLTHRRDIIEATDS